ncbi:MAG: multidrug efflux SMR transporter [Rhodospirillales bacterium]
MWTVLAMVASLGLLGIALKSLPVGTAYAIWTGVGTVGTAILGMVLFGESTTALRLACIGLIVAGIIGLKLVTPDSTCGLFTSSAQTAAFRRPGPARASGRGQARRRRHRRCARARRRQAARPGGRVG